MSVEKTKKVVRDFLLNNSAEVLSIKGDWGVGKAYFWKEAITQTKATPSSAAIIIATFPCSV